MGIMSNGDGTLARAVDQRIEDSRIHHNGDRTHPGYNHNFYLGGASVTLSFCEVAASLTGHNVKSRAHHIRVEYCCIHGSANRELDLVDAAETAFSGSDAVLIGNVIAKDPACSGNRGVIHFGQDGGGAHDGTIHMVHNTIVTPFISPVLALSAPGARARWTGNIVDDGGAGQPRQVLAQHTAGAALADFVIGSNNWLAAGFAASARATGIDPATTFVGQGARPPFVSPIGLNYHLIAPFPFLTDAGVDPATIDLPSPPGTPDSEPVRSLLGWQYRHPAAAERRPVNGLPDLGAYELSSPSGSDPGE